ncbi:cancer-related regulator of actin dynamics homolog [Anneissia japonica]|uniref:cancer-related regulator of actin dynamics homolog n=1 Tax=Anneissia japonica TaxID=1529436 RepID=UPI0014255356|nr:cancer-related regulator of actin dynamics homolog [Anneissia japonica]
MYKCMFRKLKFRKIFACITSKRKVLFLHYSKLLFYRIKSEKDGQPRKRRNTGNEATDFLMRKLELDQQMKEREFQMQREEVERRQQDEDRRREREEREEERRQQREEREEERRRHDEERRREKEEREVERRRRDEAERERKMEMFHQQLLQQNQLIMMMLKKEKE